MKRIWPLICLCLAVFSSYGHASPCEQDDYELKVTGEDQCLIMRKYGDPQPDVMLVWIHGDVSSGGNANYHFPIAEKAIGEFPSQKVLSVALVRPGYPDGAGNSSTVAFGHTGRRDHYTKKNVNEVGKAIARLQAQFKPRETVVIGHSGGAATTAILLGMLPQTVNKAVLVACPCDLVAWRVGRQAWSASENPIKWADRVATESQVIALTGNRDDNTFPALAQSYVETLRARGIRAEFKELENESHNSAFRSPEIFDSIRKLLKGDLNPQVHRHETVH
ncbi:MAG: alpha/beta hydrolase family protein [Tepidimonas ignava]|uniref:alpha/beta hydrolase family protein n=1 Tax=Tepidimonas ignava TaxID=114249 RepID=UPI003919534A